jgi:hypothetical protein
MFDVQNIQSQPIQTVIRRPHSSRGNLFRNGYKSLLLCLGLVTPAFASPNLPYNSPAKASSLASPSYHSYQHRSYEPALPSGYGSSLLQHHYLSLGTAERLSWETLSTVQPGKKPNIFSKKENKKTPPPKVHPRKKLLEEAPIHTQKAWLYSAIIPGLGQLYNKSYWEIPVIYGVFGLLAWGAIYNHDEYMTSKRELLEKCKPKKDEKTGKITQGTADQYPNLSNYMDGRKRDRTIFVASMFVWYLLNVFEAYVGGTLKTFDVSDDLEVVIQPSDNSSALQNASIGLSISLQSKNKDEDRTHWVW